MDKNTISSTNYLNEFIVKRNHLNKTTDKDIELKMYLDTLELDDTVALNLFIIYLILIKRNKSFYYRLPNALLVAICWDVYTISHTNSLVILDTVKDMDKSDSFTYHEKLFIDTKNIEL